MIKFLSINKKQYKLAWSATILSTSGINEAKHGCGLEFVVAAGRLRPYLTSIVD